MFDYLFQMVWSASVLHKIHRTLVVGRFCAGMVRNILVFHSKYHLLLILEGSKSLVFLQISDDFAEVSNADNEIAGWIRVFDIISRHAKLFLATFSWQSTSIRTSIYVPNSTDVFDIDRSFLPDRCYTPQLTRNWDHHQYQDLNSLLAVSAQFFSSSFLTSYTINIDMGWKRWEMLSFPCGVFTW